MASASADSIEPTGKTWTIRRIIKISILLLVLAGALVLLHKTPLKDISDKLIASARQYLLDHGLTWAVPLAFVVIVAGMVSIGAPRLMFCFAAGAAFGFWQGMLWAEIGTVIGSYGPFLFSRWKGRDAVLHRWPAIGRYSNALTRGGILTVLIARQLPISGVFVSIALGLTKLTHTQYLLGTALGLIPEAIPLTLLGTGVGQKSLTLSIVYIGIAVCWIVVAGLVIRRYRHYFMAEPEMQKEAAAAATETKE